MLEASGIFFVTPESKVLLCKRAQGDFQGAWALPGGKIEDGENPEEAARRECREELGFQYDGKLAFWTRRVRDDVDYVTFIARIPKEFDVHLNEEHSDAAWMDIDYALHNDDVYLHPGVRIVLQRLTMDELEVATAIRDRELASPQFFENMWLFDIRITGTGASYRPKSEEFVYRDPQLYMNDHFIQRCNGLPVIFEHPDKKPALDTEEFRNRIIGTILLPYAREDKDEVWGIAKIYDLPAAEIMLEDDLSTSPGVVFRDPSVNEYETLTNGDKMLIEGKPGLLDHIAICASGVWDKGGKPAGVEISHRIDDMADVKATARQDDSVPTDKKEGDKLDMILSHLDSLHTAIADTNSRMDAMESNFGKKDAKKDSDGGEEKNLKEEGEPTPLAADSKKDGEEGEGDTEEEEGEDGAKPKGPEFEEDAKKDAKKDGENKGFEKWAKEEEEEPEHKADAKMDAATDRRLRNIERRLPAIQSDEDRAHFAEFQAKADRVFQAFSAQDSAPRWLNGESLLGYKQRILSKLKKHSSNWKQVNLYAVKDSGVLNIAEGQILADAYQDALYPSEIQPGVLRAVTERDATGRQITRFHGDIDAAFGMFKAPVRRLNGINLKPNG